MSEIPIINLKNFILSTRDSGYKSTASALAELVDNSIEAGASKVDISVIQNKDKSYQVSVKDNGEGMSPSVLNTALQFGGSTRYNSRKSLGRFGMGLPNASLSQSRKIEVITWKSKNHVYRNILDVDEIKIGLSTIIKKPERLSGKIWNIKSKSGTIVNWLKCDRLSYKNKKNLISSISSELGRIFRYSIWSGKKILINDELIKPIDPLMQQNGLNLQGASNYGKELIYEIRTADSEKSISSVYVKFVELPIEQWHSMSNKDKRKWKITKRSGVSILRANREIDYGWFFMGTKRKENYDDWWRCEIKFLPELDELFGVTHTKQKVNPGEYLKKLISPDINQIAQRLNNRVRQKFLEVKNNNPIFIARKDIEQKDNLFEPPNLTNVIHKSVRGNSSIRSKGSIIKGLEYFLNFEKREGMDFYDINFSKSHLDLFLNMNHPFFEKLYLPLSQRDSLEDKEALKKLEILLVSAARAESLSVNDLQLTRIKEFRLKWSEILNTFLT